MPLRTWDHLLRLPSSILYPELNPTEAMAYFLALSLQVGAATVSKSAKTQENP